jgi:uncharacterized membrane-anchored protein YitT (DUF2179 family)
MKKIDLSVVVEVVGFALATIGIALLSVPAALIVSGGFLIWITEKAN